MEKFYNEFYKKIVSNPKKIITIFSIIFLICLILRPLVKVNYNLKEYLPRDTHSTVSLKLMEKEFEGAIPNVKVMINNVNISEAINYKQKLEELEGIKEVMWLDDVADIFVPLEILDKKIVENYYKDNKALFNIVIDENNAIEIINKIKNLVGEDSSITGTAVSTAVSTESTLKEIPKITIITILFVLCILILTTSSWIEPIIVLVGLGIAIVINAGSNIIFGEISFVTNAAGNILQLAVSLDYSIFLIHRFIECRKDNKDVKEAMVSALTKSTSSILSSGLTTVIGFFALILMKFKIGADLGIALGKGIAISLITVFIFMPVLILSTYKLLEKTEHKKLLPSFEKFGIFVTKIMLPMSIIFIISIPISYLASNSNKFYYGESKIFNESTKLGTDIKKIEDIFGKNDTYVLILPKGNNEKEKKLSKELKNLKEVSNIISYVDTIGEEIPEEYIPHKILSKFESENYRRIILSVNADLEGEETIALIEKIKDITQKYYKDYYFVGEGVSTYDLMHTVISDMTKVNLIAIISVFVVLLISMKSISLPIILILGIETAIWINLSVPYFTNNIIFYISYLLISSIQLGVTVDYAILLTERYKEYRKSMNKKESIINTISSVTISILTSGSVLTIVGFLLGYITSHGIISQLGLFIGRGTLFSMLIVFFVLPGLLYIFDTIINKSTKNSDFLINNKINNKKDISFSK